MRLPEDILQYAAPGGVVCSDCFRLPPDGGGALVFLTAEKLRMLGVTDLPPGWHVFCVGEEIAACEAFVKVAEAALHGWTPKHSGWPY